MTQWYYTQQGQRLGPVSDGQIKDLAANGQLKPSDLVWRKGMEKWIAANGINGLFPEKQEDEPPPLEEVPPPLQPTGTQRRVISANTTWSQLFESRTSTPGHPGYWKPKPVYWIAFAVGVATAFFVVGIFILVFLASAARTSRSDWKNQEVVAAVRQGKQ